MRTADLLRGDCPAKAKIISLSNKLRTEASVSGSRTAIHLADYLPVAQVEARDGFCLQVPPFQKLLDEIFIKPEDAFGDDFPFREVEATLPLELLPSLKKLQFTWPSQLNHLEVYTDGSYSISEDGMAAWALWFSRRSMKLRMLWAGIMVCV